MEFADINNAFTKLLELHVTEDQLNADIQSETDLTLIWLLLKSKSNFIFREKHSPFDFPLDNILKQKEHNKFCEAVQIALIVQRTNTQYMLLLKYVCEHLTIDEEPSHLVNTLKLLNVLLSVIKLKESEGYVVPINIHNHICNILSKSSDTVINFLINYTFPKYFDINQSNVTQIFHAIWQKTLNSRNLNILCAIPQFFIFSNIQKRLPNNYLLVNFKEFWILLQECIISNNSTLQKQALFLLQLAIRSLENEEHFMVDSNLVFWNTENRIETLNAWYNLFILFEISREKQLHLIEPAYQLIPAINVLDASWLLCIYKLFLLHPHNAVSMFAILHVLKGTWYENVKIFKSVVIYLLIALNKTECVQNDELWRTCDQFFNNLEHQKLIIILEESANIVWVPSICYLFYKSFFSSAHCRIEFDSIRKVVKNIEKLPHKFIRPACIHLIADFINQNLPEETLSFSHFLTINWILYQDHCLLQINYLKYLEEVKAKIVSWPNVMHVDLKEIKIILKIIESCQLEDHYVDEYILKPYLQRQFATEISDRLGLFLCLKNRQDVVVDYINYRLLNIKLNDNVCVEHIEQILNYETSLIDKLNKDCTDILLNEHSNVSQQELAFEITLTLIKQGKFKISHQIINNIETYWRKVVQLPGKLTTKLYVSFLNLYYFKHFNKCNEFTTDDQIETILIFDKMLKTQIDQLVPEIFKQLEYLINRSVSLEKTYDFVDVCMKKVNEIKGNDIFKVAIENFTKSVFCNAKALNNNQFVIENNVNIAEKLLELANSYHDVAVSLANYLCYLLNSNKLAIHPFIPVIIELLLSGEVFKKEERAEYKVCQLISQNCRELSFENNPNYRRTFIRAQVINILNETFIAQNVKEETKISIADTIVSLLMDRYGSHFNKRYFANSNIHLQKLRIFQALLLIHNHISTKKEALINLLMDSLCLESHQMSVKFLIQWLLIQLLRTNNDAIEIITQKMKSTSKVHSSTIIAFIPILYHIALYKNDEMLWGKLYETMLPWTMGAHFNLRLYAQEGLQNIYKSAIKHNFVNLVQKFQITFNCISDVLESTERKIDLVDRYVFDTFNPTDHYCLQTIYFNIPKMTNVTYEEYENVLYFKNFNTNPELHGLYKASDKMLSESVSHCRHNNVIQKKINPLNYSYRNEKQHQITELIVVASLIDKSPNLGGLTRTCEIFGVKQLILNSVNRIRDQEFQSISMSSENWINIVEVKVEGLRKFLLNLKEIGYCVLGCEQTTNSNKLDSYQFPKKTALLLGNEKEGISPDLLSVVDVCVEIPQFGVVRSLNVHVAAATFIWEYTKQHTAAYNS